MPTPKNSPLILADFSVLECFYAFVTSDKQRMFSKETYEEYPLSIEYSFDELDDLIRVFMDVEINYGDSPMDGYSMRVLGAGLFRFEDGLTDDDKLSFANSMISITLNCVRSFVMNFTGGCPFGRYVLPSVDLGDLIEQHIINEQKELAEKLPKKKSHTAKTTPKKIYKKATK